jgi:hypothetical protein
MDNASNIEEAAKWLSQKQKFIIKSLFQSKSSLPTQFFGSDKNVILKLQDRRLFSSFRIEDLLKSGMSKFCLPL